MRYEPAHSAIDDRVPLMLRAPQSLRVALSAACATVIGFVPVVLVATPAHAAPGDVNVDADIEAGESEAFTFELRREAGSADALTLNYTTVDGTATAGLDYTAVSGSTSFPAGSSRAVVKRFTVQGLPDSLDEDNETFTVRFTGLNAQNQPVVVEAGGILDDDDATPTYSLSVPDPVAEGAGNARITATLSAVSGRDVTIPFTTTDGTAVSPDDYVGTQAGSVLIPAGDTTGSANVAIDDDVADEEDLETFTVTGGTGGNGELRTGAAQSVRIADNDVLPTLEVSDPGNVTEGGVVTFTATLSALSNRDVTFVASTRDGTATANTDYTPVVAQTFTIPAGSSSTTVDVQTTGDTLNEVDPETLRLDLSAPVHATPGTATALGGITDDDNPPLVTLSPALVSEGDNGPQTKTFTVTLDNPSGRTVRVGYQVTGGTAVIGQDVAATPDGELVFAPGEVTKTFTVDVTGDRTDEADETFTVTLANPGATAGVGGSLGANQITVTDDDNTPTVTSLAALDVPEGDTAATVNARVTLSNPSDRAISLDVSALDASAVAGGAGAGSDDYDLPASTVTVAAGQTFVDVPVRINGDTVYEGAETATLRVDTQLGDANVASGFQTSTLTLGNDDAVPTVQLNAASGAEGETVAVTAGVTGAAQDDLPIVITALGAANAGGSRPADTGDFDSTALNATVIPGGFHLAPVPLGSIDLLDDTIDEDSQTVRVSLGGLTGVAPVFVTVTDDPDDLPPTIAAGDVTVGEANTPAAVAVTLDFTRAGNDALSTEKTITARYATADGTATQPGDYVTRTGTVTFEPGDISETVPVTVTDDSIYERDETFTLTLSNPAAADTPVDPAVSTVTITDDDSARKPSFSVAAPATAVREAAGATATFTVQLGAPTTQDVELDVVLTDGTARRGVGTPGNDDFTSPAAQFTVPAGQSSVQIPVTVLNDDVYEQTETAELSVTLASGEDDAVAGTPTTATLTITDDDLMPTVALNAARSSEGDGAVAITGTVTGVAQDPIAVGLSAEGAVVAGSDPAESADFSAAGLGPATVPGGVNAGPVALGTLVFDNDRVDENDETLRVTMTGLTVPVTTVATIEDNVDDMPPTVSADDLVVDEVAETVQVPVSLSFGQPGNDAVATEKTVTVGYGTADDSARTPGDYRTPAAGAVVTFAPGETSAGAEVTIVDDRVFEREEQFFVDLSNPAPAGVVVTDARAVVGISDDDSARKPSFSAGDVSYTEGAAGTANLVVTLSTVTAEPVTFDVTTADDTATTGLSTPGGDDYTPPAPTRVTVAAGQRSVTVPIAVTDDTVYEGTERVDLSVALADGEDDAVATGADGEAVLSIVDNDAVPTVALNAQSGTEGTAMAVSATVTGSAQAPMTFTLSMGGDDRPGANPAEATDYTDNDLTLTVPAGSTSGRTFAIGSIPLNQDDVDEPVEAIRVTAADDDDVVAPSTSVYTILDDPNDLPPSVSISDESIGEGEQSVDLTVSLAFDNGAATSTEQDVAVTWSTANGAARSPSDYTADSGTVTIEAGQSEARISVAVAGDDLAEGEQDFVVRLGTATPRGTVIDKAVGQVDILDDDDPSAPELSAPAGRVGAGTVTLGGSAAEGAQVQLYAAPVSAPAAFTVVATATADVLGRYAFSRTVETGTVFYTRANGFNSPQRTVRVTQVPTLTGSSSTRGTATLTVTGNPRTALQAVVIQRYNGNNTWVNVVSGRLNSAGTLTSTIRTGLVSGRSYTFRAVVSPTPSQGILGGTSANRVVAVR